MLDLALLIIIIIGFFIGLRRGFILQLIHMIGFILAFIIAHMYYGDLAPMLRLWIPYPAFDTGSTLHMVLDGINFDEAFYRAIAFTAIFFAVKIVLAIIGSTLDFVASLPILKIFNVWAGGILGLIEVYLLMFILIYIAALLPISAIQSALNDSMIADLMLNHTPYFSVELKKWWFDNIQT